MTDQQVYQLPVNIDQGNKPTETEYCDLATVKTLRWNWIEELPKGWNSCVD